MNLTTFYIVRHGETDWNIVRRIQGHTDNDINKTGELQAAKAAHNLSGIHIDLVYSSDLLRARRTAEIIVAERKLAVHTTQALRERLYGEFEGKLYDEVDAFYQKIMRAADTNEEKQVRREHGVEGDDEMMGRLITFIREVAVANPGKTVLMVSHGGIMRALLVHLGCYDKATATRVKIQNTGHIKLESDGVDFFVKDQVGVTAS